MNIFFTSTNPTSAAFNLNHPQLLKKMYVEDFQMLCTRYQIRGIDAPYKAFNPAHESSQWIDESIHNYRWLLRHVIANLAIIKDRYNLVPKIAGESPERMLDFLWEKQGELNLPDVGLTLPYLAMKNTAPDLVAKYGTPVELVSPKTGKTNVAYRAKSFHEAVAAYKQFLQRKNYWQPEYTFIK